MPSRIVRDEYLDSERYAQVDDLAKLTWHHMLSLADDFGVVSLAPTFVRRRMFYCSPSDATVSRVLDQLQSADLIRIYAHEEGRYALIPRFRQRIQRYTLKHPMPPPELYRDDPWLQEKLQEIQEHDQKSNCWPTVKTRDQPLPNGPEEKRREEKGREDKAKSSRQAKGARLPADWIPSVQDIEFCKANRPDLDPGLTADRFRDYWTAMPGSKGVKLDWPATWRNWVRNEKGPNRGNSSQRFSPARATAERLRALEGGVGAQVAPALGGDVWPLIPKLV